MTRSSAAQRKARAASTSVDAALELELEQDELAFDGDELEFDGLDEFDGFAEALHGGDDHELPFTDARYVDLAPADQEALRAELQDRLDAYLAQGRARVVITDNVRTMCSIKRGHGVYSFRLHHMFIDAPPRILRAITAYAERQDREAAELLREFIDVNDDAIRRRAEPRQVCVDVEGRHHNLQAIFDELNARYFGGAIRARITWGPRGRRKRGRTSIKLGSYTVEDELIRVHPVLDAEDVPRYYLAWVIYHEMLHEIHDMPVVDGRRVYHTPAFRQAEAKFEQYPEAVLWERTHLHRLLDR